jgi:hypothetical protein
MGVPLKEGVRGTSRDGATRPFWEVPVLSFGTDP